MNSTDVVTVKPAERMRAQFQAQLPYVVVMDGRDTEISLDDSVDAVFVTRAFHWFDVPAALAEIYRVLIRGAVLDCHGTRGTSPLSGWHASVVRCSGTFIIPTW